MGCWKLHALKSKRTGEGGGYKGVTGEEVGGGGEGLLKHLQQTGELCWGLDVSMELLQNQVTCFEQEEQSDRGTHFS